MPRGLAFDHDAVWSRFRKLSEQPVLPKPTAQTSIVISADISSRIACRTSRLADLAKVEGPARRDAIARLWILSGCKACGACADMAAK
jgi:hypothetical protein